ncbi:MAG: glutamine synthetase type III, partial [Oscillospiraceae bacterium]
MDEYSDLLCASVSGAGNDRRLGGNEAPPAIISIFLGELLTDLLTEIETGGESAFRQGGSLQIGVTTIPNLPKDVSDRNRTSPFAFTGNKFEFRMVGSSMSIADCNTVMNTIVAETLSKIADRMENSVDLNAETRDIIRDVMRGHKRIIFNGNNYSKEWRDEAERRGLQTMDCAVDSAKALISPKNIALMERHGVLSRKELEARYEIRQENYSKVLNIEAQTMIEMSKREITPAVIKYIAFMAKSLNDVKATGLAVDISVQAGLLKDVSAGSAKFKAVQAKLEKTLEKAPDMEDAVVRAEYFNAKVLPLMDELRESVDRLEVMMGDEFWP